MTPYDQVRVWSRLVEQGECWVDTGGKYKRGQGYGSISINGRSRRLHLVVYELVNGPIPPGTIVRHTCNNDACCRPEHLKPGTHKQNAADARAAGRHAAGERHGGAKLNRAAVRVLRHPAAKYLPRTVLAAALRVDVSTLRRAAKGESWKVA